MLLFSSLTHFPPLPTPSLTPLNHKSVLHVYSFVVSRVLHTWNHAVFNLLRLICFAQHNSLEIDLGCRVYQ